MHIMFEQTQQLLYTSVRLSKTVQYWTGSIKFKIKQNKLNFDFVGFITCSNKWTQNVVLSKIQSNIYKITLQFNAEL
jgi:hypothetical protein